MPARGWSLAGHVCDPRGGTALAGSSAMEPGSGASATGGKGTQGPGGTARTPPALICGSATTARCLQAKTGGPVGLVASGRLSGALGSLDWLCPTSGWWREQAGSASARERRTGPVQVSEAPTGPCQGQSAYPREGRVRPARALHTGVWEQGLRLRLLGAVHRRAGGCGSCPRLLSHGSMGSREHITLCSAKPCQQP